MSNKTLTDTLLAEKKNITLEGNACEKQQGNRPKIDHLSRVQKDPKKTVNPWLRSYYMETRLQREHIWLVFTFQGFVVNFRIFPFTLGHHCLLLLNHYLGRVFFMVLSVF